ncbi:MAG TPA: asparagine synthase (glutamine-hydrolyzing) [Polyangiaceae bacterium]|nr:asparagine synthase (glutamine-hydrolyzing) [Polyangiaceae bacterium]
MCGIAGAFHFGPGVGGDDLADGARRMAVALAHRGPDDSGVWTDAAAGVALSHRRLSIVDLSALGHQPMVSSSRRYVVAFNGEIYNYRVLRDELSKGGGVFRGHSDTEVLLEAVEQWGIRVALERFNGMFALALWDASERALYLARDRFGEKPLYYGLFGGVLLFASELKAFRVHRSFEGRVDRGSLAQFLRYGYVPAPRTIFEGARKVPAASFVRIASRDTVDREPTPYWSLVDVACEARRRPFRGSDEDAIHDLDMRLRESIKLRMISDVPLGAFLSGGIDSSTVVSLMQAQSERAVQTFSIGFREEAYNEARWAKAIAEHLGTQHTELYVTPSEARDVIPRLPSMYDEPFADSSQIPTFLVSQLARRSVTVALSGDGGDELFGGYVRYFWAQALWRPLSVLPLPARAWVASALRHLRPADVDRIIGALEPVLPQRLRQRTPGEKLQKVVGLLSAKKEDDVYFHLVSIWREPEKLVHASEPKHALLQGEPLPLPDFTDRMMCADAVTYLPDDILVKLDRAAMAVSLEGRVPLLDPAVAAFAWSLPRRLKIRQGKGKWILREVLAKYVPRALFERPKAGFGVPVGAWIRGPLREWAEEQLSESRLRREGYLDSAPVREKWAAHLEGRTDAMFHLWAILMFESWLDAWQQPTRQAEPGPSPAQWARE